MQTPSSKSSQTARADLDGQPGLPDATRPGQRDEPVPADQRPHGVDAARRLDERRDQRRKVADAHCPGFVGHQARVLTEDAQLEVLHLGRWIETERLLERRSQPLVAAERIGLLSSPVLGDDQRRPQDLAQRMFADELGETSDQFTAGPSGKAANLFVFDDADTNLFEP